MDGNGEITKAQLFDLLNARYTETVDRDIQFNGKPIWSIVVCSKYPDELYDFDSKEYGRDVFCIFGVSLYLMKEDVIDLLRGKSVSICNKKGIEVLTIKAEE